MRALGPEGGASPTARVVVPMLAAVRPPIVREPLGRVDRRWFVAAVLAMVAALAAILIVTTPRAQTGDPTVDVAARLWLAICTAAIVGVLAARIPRATKGIVVAIVAGAGFMIAATLVLSANDFGPFGAALDQSYRTALVTKYAAGWGWVDYAFKGLPVYYPPLTFWLLGRAAALFSIAPWKMLKIDLLATAFLVPVLTWPIWRRLVGAGAAIGAVLATLLLFQSWYRLHSWLGVAVFIPWWLWAVLGVGRSPARSRVELVAASVIGGALVCTYYFPFVLGAIALVPLLVLRRAAASRGVALPPEDLRRAGIVLAGSAVLSAPYWAPLLVSVLRNGGQVGFNRFYTAGFVDVRFRFLTFDVIGVVMLFGLASLLVTACRSTVSLALLALLGAAFVYYLADYVGVLANFPLLSTEANDVADAVLAAGAGIGAVQLWRAAQGSEALRARLGRSGIAATAAVVATVLGFSLAQTAVEAIPYVAQQRAARVPTALLADFQRAAGRPVANTVVLTDISDLPAFLPLYVFNWSNVQTPFSPAGNYQDRTAFLHELSGEQDPTAFAIAMLHNVFDRVDLVALRPGSSGVFQYTFYDDAFPRPPILRTFEFDASQFRTRTFQEVDTSQVTVFRIRRAHDPLRSLASCPRDPTRPACQVLGSVTRRYGGDLDGAVADLAARWASARGRDPTATFSGG